MKTNITLDKSDLNNMYDVIVEALNIEPTDEQIIEFFYELPDHIKGLAVQWGTSDTVFRDDMFVWLKENKTK